MYHNFFKKSLTLPKKIEIVSLFYEQKTKNELPWQKVLTIWRLLMKNCKIFSGFVRKVVKKCTFSIKPLTLELSETVFPKKLIFFDAPQGWRPRFLKSN